MNVREMSSNVRRYPLKCALVLILGILGTNSGADPYSKQPRFVVEDGHLTIQSGFNRNVSIASNGEGGVFVNRVSLSRLAQSSPGDRVIGASTLARFLNKMTQITNQLQSMADLPSQVSQLEENVTEISQRLNQFMGSDRNRITNRGMRRVFAKVKTLEDRVNRLTELLSANECSSNPCRNGGTCVDSYNGYVCNCPRNWEGPTCDSDVNECALYAGTGFGCQNGATCTNLPGSYRCDCPTNWFGIHCTEQHDDCTSASHQELCGHGTCVNEKRVLPGQPKYRCLCEPGWRTSSTSPACTEDVDECAGPEQKCSVSPRVVCYNLPGTFVCGSCPAGYTGNGLWCDDLNECEINNGGCSTNPYVECYNTPGSRRCGPCPNGYFGNGQQCMFQSACSNNRGGCHPLATCIDNPAITMTYRECRCPPGFVGNGEGLTGCVQTQASLAMTCTNNPCQHGTCQMIGNSYHCICEAGYYGTNCEIAENPCASNPCQNGATCRSQGATTFSCDCPNGYSGLTCAEQRRSCGGYLSGPNGTLHYPEYSTHYDHKEDCAWVVSVEAGKVVNITFDHFHLEVGFNCEHDFLQLNDGYYPGARVIGRFCSDQLHGDSFNSTHNQVYLWFHSDRSISATGFTIRWQAVDPVCGGVLNASEYGSVRSPGYPGLYPVNRTCSWLVQVPYGKRIQFNFATLMMEHHENCSFDYLKIFDGANDREPVIGTYCTSVTPPPLITSGHTATLLFHSDATVQDYGFNIAYSAMPGFDGCGGTLTAPRQIITSPNFPDDYRSNRRCEWLVRIRPNNRIRISFSELNLDSHPDCRFDSIEIFNGPTEVSPLLGRFCGNTLPPDVLSDSHQLFVRFTLRSYGAGFKLEYKTICGGVFTDLSGVLTSPFYPEPYEAHTSCVYEIHLPEGHLVNLTLHNVEIEIHPNCRFDYLEIRDGDSESSPSMAMICGSPSVKNFLSSYNKLWLKFETDGSIQNRGFSAQYEAIDVGCGGIQTENSSQISSPRHPEYYPHNVSCIWLIRAPENYIIRLTFTNFRLEGSGTCAYDYVQVEDADGVQVGKYCGNTPPPVLTSMGNTLVVKFVTDESVAKDGFSADYLFLDVSQACGGDFYQASGIIRSPGFPRNYPHLAKCVWVLHAPNLRQITLNVTDFQTEMHADCRYDYLEIRNGGYKTSPLIGKYCGTQIMSVIQSHSNLMRLEFQSDSSMSAPGFQIQFDSSVIGCGGTLRSSTGSITSPNYPQAYPINADCEWLIRVSEGSIISFSIIDIDIEEHQTCQFDYLQIFDGPTENAKTLTRLCNNQQNPGPIVSKDNSLLVRFRSDVTESAGGFHLVYQTLCNNELTKRRGVIESPNFPNPYPHNHNCTWTIKAPMGSNISLSFSHLFIEEGTNCSMDYVQVQEIRYKEDDTPETVSLGKFCGDMTRDQSTIITSSHHAVVRLITDRSISREGFRLEYSFIGCGGDIFDKSYGYISSPNYPNGYPLKTECFWHIWYPPGNSVQMNITDLDLESSSRCRFDFLQIHAGENAQSPVILSDCHALNGTMVLSSNGNHMFVHFMSDISVGHKGFRASYQKINKVCGGYFTANKATIMSPNFPDPYTVTDECEWLIEVNPAYSVVLEFYDFELPEAVNCTLGHVAIFDGNNSTAPLLLKHCGSKPEGLVSSTGNQMLVKLVVDGINVAKGFRAFYKEGCGRRLLADEGGVITTPRYPQMVNAYEPDSNCSWIIYTPQIGEKVILTTTYLNIPNGPYMMDPYANCTNSITVFDGDMDDSPVIKQFCGQRLPPPIISRGSALHVFLKNVGVFRATYGLVSEHCGGDFTAVSGSFASPGYPTNYDMEIECVWTILASAGSKVHISFQSFQLETSDYCNTDYVEIHENDPSGRLIGKYCGDNIPSNLTSSHKLWIKFRTDDIGTAAGFIAHYEIQHDTTITGTSGEIASPGYPEKLRSFDAYSWTIIAPTGTTISVLFQVLEIPRTEENSCFYEKVKIIDGIDDNSPVLGTYCGYTVPEVILSSGNVIRVTFETNYHPGIFYLRWSAVNETGVRIAEDSSCFEEHILNATNRAIVKSPNYPSNYPNNYNCTYVIRTVPTHHVSLRFTEFLLEGVLPVCAYDKLESYIAPNPNVDNWTLNSTLCGVSPTEIQLRSPNNLVKLEMSSDSWVNAKGFQAFATAECGGQIFGNSGVLRSSSIYPNLQNSSSDTFQCEWTIEVKDRRTIQLTFDTFNIEPDSSPCSTNYILLRNGGSKTSPVLGDGKYCGTNPPTVPESGSNQVYVQLVFKPSTARSPIFDLRYSVVTVGCGGRIYLSPDVPAAEITSPNYPAPSTLDAECEWIIVSPAGSRMRVDFESQFHLGNNCYYGDNIDYLELHDGGTEHSPLIRRYCGNAQPSSAMSTGNALYMKYVTGSDEKEAGFKATVRIAHCGGTISSQGNNVITSPDFPLSNYGNYIECEWFLKMTYGYWIRLTITEFETPASSNCSLTDYLEIRDMDDQGNKGEVLSTLCGNPSDLPKVIDVPGPFAYVKFKSNSAITAKGFSMSMSANYDEGCGEMLDDPTGVITSPRYPNAIQYPRDCYWRISAPAGRKVKVVFEEINLPYEENLNTCTSYVQIYNISQRYFQRNANLGEYHYCGTTPPAEIDSTSGNMYIIFKTRGLASGQGFKLRYSTEEESICGGVLSDRSGVVSSPDFANRSFVDCKWTINIEQNQTLVLNFAYVDVPGNVVNFCRDSVLVVATDGRYQGVFCGNITNPFLVMSPYSATDLRLLFTPQNALARGFHATYNVSNCGGVFDGSNAEITSPGYPNNYPPGTDCNWVLFVPYGEILQITFVDFRLEEDCSKDYVLIHNGKMRQSPVLGKFCGSHSIAPIVSAAGSVSIEFHSDAFGTAPGFKISTTEIQRGCGGLIHKHSGNFSSPNYPSRYDNNVECIWTIEYAAGYLVKLDFSGRFDIEASSGCPKDYLKVEYMSSEGRWSSVDQLCGSVTPQPMISSTNKMRITFHSDDRINGDGFNLAYSAVCGGTFTQPSGDIISPNYPDLYANALNCSYVIGKQGDYVSLTFDDYFSIEANDNCVFDYIEIYQKEVNASNKQGGFCGSTAPAPRALHGPVTLRFITDYVYVANGFKVHYEILNCGEVLSSPSGFIATPKTTLQYINQLDCTWRIIAPPNKVIQLRFLHFNITASYSCFSDYLDVYDGSIPTNSNRTAGRRIGKLCGSGVKNIKSTTNELTLRLHASSSRTTGFEAYYYNTYGPNQGCGGTLNATTGEISSLDADSNGSYEPNLDCVWMISVSDPDQIMQLTFLSFDLQMPMNGSCDSSDYVEMREYDADGPLIGRFCGNRLPSPLLTNVDLVFVHFHSDEAGSNAGFRMAYTLIPSPCGQSRILIGSEAQVVSMSPGYPTSYPPNLRCKWLIYTNSTSMGYSANNLELSVTDIDIPCGGDYLQILPTNRIVGEARISKNAQMLSSTKLCGSTPPQVFRFRFGAIVTFNSDAVSNGGRGFTLSSKKTNCNTSHTGDSGVIISDHFPLRYNYGFACRTVITVSSGKTVALYFRYFSLGGSDCESNYMKLYDGADVSSPLLVKICSSSSIPSPAFSTGNSMYVEVMMPAAMGLYWMTYMASEKGNGCGGSISATEGDFTSPLFPQPYNRPDECVWRVSVPGYYDIRLEVKSFALNSTANCDVNYLEIYEGTTTDISHRVGRFCGQDILGGYELRTNAATVKLVTDATNDQSGFSIHFASSRIASNPSDIPYFAQNFDTGENRD